jgi:hypothetical protein
MGDSGDEYYEEHYEEQYDDNPNNIDDDDDPDNDFEAYKNTLYEDFDIEDLEGMELVEPLTDYQFTETENHIDNINEINRKYDCEEISFEVYNELIIKEHYRYVEKRVNENRYNEVLNKQIIEEIKDIFTMVESDRKNVNVDALSNSIEKVFEKYNKLVETDKFDKMFETNWINQDLSKVLNDQVPVHYYEILKTIVEGPKGEEEINEYIDTRMEIYLTFINYHYTFNKLHMDIRIALITSLNDVRSDVKTAIDSGVVGYDLLEFTKAKILEKINELITKYSSSLLDESNNLAIRSVISQIREVYIRDNTMTMVRQFTDDEIQKDFENFRMTGNINAIANKYGRYVDSEYFEWACKTKSSNASFKNHKKLTFNENTIIRETELKDNIFRRKIKKVLEGLPVEILRNCVDSMINAGILPVPKLGMSNQDLFINSLYDRRTPLWAFEIKYSDTIKDYANMVSKEANNFSIGMDVLKTHWLLTAYGKYSQSQQQPQQRPEENTNYYIPRGYWSSGHKVKLPLDINFLVVKDELDLTAPLKNTSVYPIKVWVNAVNAGTGTGNEHTKETLRDVYDHTLVTYLDMTPEERQSVDEKVMSILDSKYHSEFKDGIPNDGPLYYIYPPEYPEIPDHAKEDQIYDIFRKYRSDTEKYVRLITTDPRLDPYAKIGVPITNKLYDNINNIYDGLHEVSAAHEKETIKPGDYICLKFDLVSQRKQFEAKVLYFMTNEEKIKMQSRVLTHQEVLDFQSQYVLNHTTGQLNEQFINNTDIITAAIMHGISQSPVLQYFKLEDNYADSYIVRDTNSKGELIVYRIKIVSTKITHYSGWMLNELSVDESENGPYRYKYPLVYTDFKNYLRAYRNNMITRYEYFRGIDLLTDDQYKLSTVYYERIEAISNYLREPMMLNAIRQQDKHYRERELTRRELQSKIISGITPSTTETAHRLMTTNFLL